MLFFFMSNPQNFKVAYYETAFYPKCMVNMLSIMLNFMLKKTQGMLDFWARECTKCTKTFQGTVKSIYLIS